MTVPLAAFPSPVLPTGDLMKRWFKSIWRFVPLLADALPCWNIIFKFTFPQAAILMAVLIAWWATQQEGRRNQEGTGTVTQP